MTFGLGENGKMHEFIFIFVASKWNAFWLVHSEARGLLSDPSPTFILCVFEQ